MLDHIVNWYYKSSKYIMFLILIVSAICIVHNLIHNILFLQKNLFASGASDSEIFIWDLNNPANPMTPGAKTQPSSAVNALSWNCQVYCL